jgi:hypothetical protein
MTQTITLDEEQFATILKFEEANKNLANQIAKFGNI